MFVDDDAGSSWEGWHADASITPQARRHESLCARRGCRSPLGGAGWRTWWELARLAGFAYLLGVAALGVTSTLVLVVGIPFSLVTVLLTGLVLAAAGIAGGLRLGRPRPVLGAGPGANRGSWARLWPGS